ncbi:MAG: hypothetical protein KBS63_01080 [Clostridiales bacterium]|nr:hypothetical protein [Candidatus Crickella caballi]
MYFNCTESVRRDLDCEKKMLAKFNHRMSYLKKYEGYYLKISESHKTPQYYMVKRENGKELHQYLKKNEQRIVDELQEYRYLKYSIDACIRNISCMEALLSQYKSLSPADVTKNFGRAYQQQNNANALIYSYRNTRDWISSKESVKSAHEIYRPEGLIHIAGDGTAKRSKSEVVISDCLNSLGIPHIYECPVKVNGYRLLPDFICLDASTGQEVLIEHFGYMAEDSYREKTYEKLENYINAGYLINVDLLVFFEDINGNINAESIYNMLRTRFHK